MGNGPIPIPIPQISVQVYSIGSRWKPGMSLGGDKRLGPQLQRRILAFLAGEASQEAVSGSLEKRLEAKGATTAGKLVVHACLGVFDDDDDDDRCCS